VTFVQRFGGSINANLHFHVVFLDGVFVDRTTQGLTPRFLPADPPTDTDIATVLQPISRRVIRQLRKRGYLEADTEDVVPTGYDPASDEDPELARTLAASVQQRIACGERAGQQVRRIGSRCASVNGFSLYATTSIPAHRRDQLERLLRYTARGAVPLERLEVNADSDLLYTFTHPWSDGTTGITRSPMELLEQRAALVPLPRQPQVRYGGCLAQHRHLRAIIIPTPRQQGREAPADRSPSPHWTWARLLKRVFAMGMARCPVCQ
jgi:putative transposase